MTETVNKIMMLQDLCEFSDGEQNPFFDCTDLTVTDTVGAIVGSDTSNTGVDDGVSVFPSDRKTTVYPLPHGTGSKRYVTMPPVALKETDETLDTRTPF